MALIKQNGIVLAKHIDTTKGLKIDSDAHKIQVFTDETLTFEQGKLKVSDSITNNSINRAELETNTLKLIKNDGSQVTVDLTPIVPKIDMHVKMAQLSGTQLSLTLEGNETPVTVDLAELAASSVASSDTVTLLGNGSSANPLTANVKLDSDNLIKQSNKGLKVEKPQVEVTSLDGEVLFYAYGSSQVS